MSDEIKEIIEAFEELITHKNDASIQTYNLFDKIQSLLDYITNLQTIEQQYSAVLSENAELKNKISDLEDTLIDKKEYCYGLETQLTILQKENERLNNEIKTLLKENGNKEKVIIKQNNIIDELEKWLESEIDRVIKLINPKKGIKPYGEENYYYENMILRYKEVLDKLQELKGSDRDVKN